MTTNRKINVFTELKLVAYQTRFTAVLGYFNNAENQMYNIVGPTLERSTSVRLAVYLFA